MQVRPLPRPNPSNGRLIFTMKSGAELIAEERARQIAAEGWTAEHDDMHSHGELSAAADAYRIYTDKLLEFGDKLPPCFIPKQWPWERQWWKPSKDPVRNLVKAGALYQAQADYCRRHNRQDECDIAEQFCVRFVAQKIDQLQSAG
jgi:hypothetical protein